MGQFYLTFHNSVFSQLEFQWNNDCWVKNDFARRELLVELDVIVAMIMGITLDELIMIYNTYFPVLKQYEQDTWYDSLGQIVFTNNRSLTNVGIQRGEWESIRNWAEGVYRVEILDDTVPDGPISRIKEYVAPFERCNRQDDYELVWKNIEKRL